ncbi:MAG: cobalt transport protein [Clostridiales bacterium]|nr:cobalt transport protein [Clostridiales bacterium]
MRGFADRNPIAVAACLLAPAGVAMFSMDPLLLALALLGGLVTFLLVGGKGGHGWTLALFCFMALLNPLTYHNGATVLFVLNGNPITLQALLYGLTAAGMIVAVMYWFRCFSHIMTSDRLMYLLGGLSPRLALLLSMTLRYVPLFGTQAKKIQQSQRALGLYKDDNIVDSFRGGLRVFSVMVTWTLENGIITADSMTARGYGLGRRTHFSLFRFTRQDALLLAAALTLTALTIWGMTGRAVAYYPTFRFDPLTTRAMTGYAAYGLLTLLPAIHIGKEALTWHCFKSRT